MTYEELIVHLLTKLTPKQRKQPARFIEPYDDGRYFNIGGTSVTVDSQPDDYKRHDLPALPDGTICMY